MRKSRGPEVFGHVDTVDELRKQLRQAEETLLGYGPSRSPFLLDEDEEGEE
ncbi:hypothetical protein ABTX62_35045 [Streptomyces sp. NPDC096046]|uniref:hypothetical protein n=1 Tax=Streptomyces sp. NPDC096046 TaxID=3155542 RepID=UPI00331B8EAC